MYVVDSFYLLFPFSFIIISSPSLSLSQRRSGITYRTVSVNLDYASSSVNAWCGTQVDHTEVEYIYSSTALRPLCLQFF